MKLPWILTAHVALCACQSLSKTTPPLECNHRHKDEYLQFSFDGCFWKVEREEGPDFQILTIEDLDGRRIAGLYLGGAPDVRYQKQGVKPKICDHEKGSLAEAEGQNGYEALISLPKDRYGRLLYIHVLAPPLSATELDRLKNTVHSIRVAK